MNETRITAKGIMEDADKLINQVCKSQFPVEIFPTMIRKIIWKMKEALTYPDIWLDSNDDGFCLWCYDNQYVCLLLYQQILANESKHTLL